MLSSFQGKTKTDLNRLWQHPKQIETVISFTKLVRYKSFWVLLFETTNQPISSSLCWSGSAPPGPIRADHLGQPNGATGLYGYPVEKPAQTCVSLCTALCNSDYHWLSTITISMSIPCLCFCFSALGNSGDIPWKNMSKHIHFSLRYLEVAYISASWVPDRNPGEWLIWAWQQSLESAARKHRGFDVHLSHQPIWALDSYHNHVPPFSI